MKRSIARKWAKALESGEYQQTRGELRNMDRFCCLGVLCNIHAQEHPEIAAEQTSMFEYMGEENELPFEVREWVGMDSASGKFPRGLIKELPYAVSLIDLNDEAEWTFKQIAKVIRKHYKEL
jgi:hypothetical protein